MTSNNAPVSVLSGHVSDALNKILQYHVPHGAVIADPTYGQGLLWLKVPDDDYTVIGTDILLGTAIEDSFDYDFLPVDCVVYDPPYMFGVHNTNDPRAAMYGGYSQSYEQLLGFMDIAIGFLPAWLKPGGLLIVKCSDQYYKPEHKLYLHHVTWLEKLQLRYNILDFYVYKHDRVSPTAWQVKNRRSNVIMHTYFIVAELV